MHAGALFKINVVIVAMFLVACQPSDTSRRNMYQPVPTIVEPGLAYGQPCSPPCWRGLTPGKSTSADVAKAIEQLKASGWAKSIVEYPAAGFSAYPSPVTIDGSVDVAVDDGIVHDILGRLLFDYSVGEMVRQLGEPESLRLVYRVKPLHDSCSEQGPQDKPKPAENSAPFVVLYPNRGMVFLALAPFSEWGLICPDMKIVVFCYYSALPLQEALKGDYLANICGLEALRGVADKDLIKWHGFGSGY